MRELQMRFKNKTKGEITMQVLGISYNTNTNGDTISTLYVSSEFEPYYQNPEAGRNCQGVRTESIYVGDFDVSDIKVGMEIEISYDKAIQTKHGLYQPIKRIDIIG